MFMNNRIAIARQHAEPKIILVYAIHLGIQVNNSIPISSYKIPTRPNTIPHNIDTPTD